MSRVRPAARAAALLLSALAASSGLAQQPRQYTVADYAQAEKFMAYNANPLAYKGLVHAVWMEDGRLWYREVEDNPDSLAVTYMLVDPAKGTRSPAFDQSALAAAL